MIGAFIGGAASAEYTNDYLTGKVNEHISTTNKKYGISDDISS